MTTTSAASTKRPTAQLLEESSGWGECVTGCGHDFHEPVGFQDHLCVYLGRASPGLDLPLRWSGSGLYKIH